MPSPHHHLGLLFGQSFVTNDQDILIEQSWFISNETTRFDNLKYDFRGRASKILNFPDGPFPPDPQIACKTLCSVLSQPKLASPLIGLLHCKCQVHNKI